MFPPSDAAPLSDRRIHTVVLRSFAWFGLRPVSVASWTDWDITFDPQWQALTFRRRADKKLRLFVVPMANVRYIELDEWPKTSVRG